MSIISLPARVCAEHAREFWTGLLAYAHARSGPCVSLERMCDCPLCGELSAEQARTLAAARPGPSSADDADFTIAIAS
jgi:hypothetical protein